MWVRTRSFNSSELRNPPSVVLELQAWQEAGLNKVLLTAGCGAPPRLVPQFQRGFGHKVTLLQAKPGKNHFLLRSEPGFILWLHYFSVLSGRVLGAVPLRRSRSLGQRYSHKPGMQILLTERKFFKLIHRDSTLKCANMGCFQADFGD